jgi:hypothetical protein
MGYFVSGNQDYKGMQSFYKPVSSITTNLGPKKILATLGISTKTNSHAKNNITIQGLY